MRYCDICQSFCGITVFVDIFRDIAVLGTPNVTLVIIRVITKSDDRAARVGFVYHEYGHRLNWTTRGLYFYFTLSIFWTDQSKEERRKQAIKPLLKHQPRKYRTLNQGQTMQHRELHALLFTGNVWIL